MITAVCIFHAAMGIFAKLASISLVDLTQVDGHYRAARAWFVNRNHFAAFISLTLIGALSLQFKELIGANSRTTKSKFIEQVVSYRVIYLLLILVAILALILSESRSGFLAILISLISVVWMIGGTSKSIFKKRLLIIPVLLIAVASLMYLGDDLIQRFGVGNEFLGERSEQWAMTWTAIKAEWLLGYGGNTYAEVFQMNRGYFDLRDVIYDQAHNDYLHIWLEQGLVGLCLWLAFVALSIRCAMLGLAKTSSTLVYAVVIAGIVVVVAALVQALVGFNLHIVTIRFYFFAIMALIVASPTISQNKSRDGRILLV